MPARITVLRRVLIAVLLSASYLTIGATALGSAGKFWWLLDLLSHFRAQYACILGLAMIGLIAFKRWRVLWLAFAALLLNVFEVGRLHVPAQAAPRDVHAPVLKLLQFNAWHLRNRDPAAIASYIQSSDRDIVFIQESSPAIIANLESLVSHYRIVEQPSPAKPHQSVILLKQPRESGVELVEVNTFMPDGAIELRVRWQDTVIAFLSPHITAPGSPRRNAARQNEFGMIANWTWIQRGPFVIVGDLNCTPWSADFRSVCAYTSVVNSQQGYGFQGTWPRRSPRWLTWVFTIPIDHCLHSSSLVTIDRRIGPNLGSDHLPLEVTLNLKENRSTPSGTGLR
jgi:endonuclease/exonuclease/phosphatase (EEP) superfamily protein YafD